MHPIFATGGQAVNAVPIWFVTAATHDAVLKKLDAQERAFAETIAANWDRFAELSLRESGVALAHPQ